MAREKASDPLTCELDLWANNRRETFLVTSLACHLVRIKYWTWRVCVRWRRQRLQRHYSPRGGREWKPDWTEPTKGCWSRAGDESPLHRFKCPEREVALWTGSETRCEAVEVTATACGSGHARLKAPHPARFPSTPRLLWRERESDQRRAPRR